jgi:hypothetical protein
MEMEEFGTEMKEFDTGTENFKGKCEKIYCQILLKE